MAKKRKPKSPSAKRDSGKYEHPIPSRELIVEVMSAESTPMPFDEIVAALGLRKVNDVDALTRRINAMERDGQIVRNRKGAYLPVDHTDLIRGRVSGNANGFGFLIPDEGGDDLFLSPRQMRSLLHGDRAVVRLSGVDRQGRKEGAVVEILERHNQQVVGRYFRERGVGFVAPDNKRLHLDILIPSEHSHEAQNGQIVMAAILEQPSKRSQPIGKIVEVLGDHMAPGMEMDVAIRSHGLPHEWPDDVMTEAAGFGEKVTPKHAKGRLDLRDVPLVTIDGEDAKDFDDAVYAERRGQGWRLLVAIADVSHYIKRGSALDREAQQRGTSVYFPGRVIAMLPEVMSNGLCSLKPEVNRLCMVCDMRIDADGELKRYQFFEAVMRSHARLTYTEVAQMLLERDTEVREQYRALVPHLKDLHALYKKLFKARSRRGAIDFDSIESRIVFGADSKIEQIVPVERNDAHRLIEECMIAANVAAARYLKAKKMPALYRVHDGPDSDKLLNLREFLGELALKLGGGAKPKAKDFARLVSKIKTRPDAHIIQTVLLRSLMQAVYSPDNVGHFGLALANYMHFTSPIRRYPDLLVHRAIRHLLKGGKPMSFAYDHNDLVELGEHCSMTERRADDATRDAVSWLKCEYMLDKVGEQFDGIVSAVTSFGLFVELKDIYVEGLVHVTALSNDYYHFDATGHRLQGKRSGRVYRLGDAMRVLVARVDLDERKIDFEPLEVEGKPRKRRR
ncbi:MAG: ribonuclease R [Gammaproteobacteria bacterium]